MRKEKEFNLGISDLLDMVRDILDNEFGQIILLLFILLLDIICRIVKKLEKHTEEKSE